MAQVTLYLDDDTKELLRRSARQAGLSQSRWVARVIQHTAATTWPQSFVRAIGSWPDAPTAEELRAGEGEDVPRERF